jgi:apolipoprotein N-acyltransferase
VNQNLIKKISLALCGGIFMGLSPAPLNFWYLAWIALVPLYLLINHSKNLKETALIGLIWGLGYHGLALFWITGIHPMNWMGVPWFASLLIAISCWLVISFWGALLVVIWSILLKILKLDQINFVLLRVIVTVSLWSILERIWSLTPLWWSALAYTQSPGNLVILHLGQISGFNTVTMALVLVNILIAESYLKFNQNNQNKIDQFILPIISGVTLIFLHILGFMFYIIPLNNQPEMALNIGIIQGNIPNEIKFSQGGFFRAIENYTKGYKQLVNQAVDVVLTPETALPFFWNDVVKYSSFYQAILSEKVPALIGAFSQENNSLTNSLTNSLFLVKGDGQIFSRYDKIKLVPLGEYIPFENIFGSIIDRLSPLDAHLIRGKSEQSFETPWGKAIVGICYDSAFGDLFRRQALQGGEFIITASNNAHYSDSMPAQHHAQDIMRAIETDRWIARATNTGYSAIVDPHGVTHWLSEINRYQLHSDVIYRRQSQTLYVRFGDWLTWGLGLFSIGIIIYLVRN